MTTATTRNYTTFDPTLERLLIGNKNCIDNNRINNISVMPVKGTRQFNLPEKLHFMCAFCCNESNCSVVNENKETSRLHDYLEAIYPNGYCLGQAHKLQVSHDQVQVKGNLEQFYESNPEAPVVIDTSPNLLGTTITIKEGDTLKKLIECLNEKLILEGQPEISLACMEVIEELFKFVLSD